MIFYIFCPHTERGLLKKKKKNGINVLPRTCRVLFTCRGRNSWLILAYLCYFQRELQIQHGTQANPRTPYFCGVQEMTLASKAAS